MVRSLGAKNLIDYRIEDYSESDEKFDLVFDAVGKTSKSKAKNVLKAKGAFVSVEMLTQEKQEHLKQIKELAENEEIKPFIDRTFGLRDIVKAHEYVDTGRKRGNVTIEVIWVVVKSKQNRRNICLTFLRNSETVNRFVMLWYTTTYGFL